MDKKNSEIMNKQELVNQIALDAGATKKEVTSFIDSFTKVVTDATQQKRIISLVGLMKFEPRLKKGSIKTNPATGEKVNVPDKYVVKIKAGRKLQDAANSG